MSRKSLNLLQSWYKTKNLNYAGTITLSLRRSKLNQTFLYGLIAAILTERKNKSNQNTLQQNASLEDLPSTRVAYATLLSNNVGPLTDIREQSSKLQFLQRKHPQSVFVAFPNNQRYKINCFLVQNNTPHFRQKLTPSMIFDLVQIM